MLRVVREDGVEDPGEAEDGVEDHDGVVRPFLVEGGDVPEEGVPAVWLEEGEIHEYVPDRCESKYGLSCAKIRSLGGTYRCRYR